MKKNNITIICDRLLWFKVLHLKNYKKKALKINHTASHDYQMEAFGSNMLLFFSASIHISFTIGYLWLTLDKPICASKTLTN